MAANVRHSHDSSDWYTPTAIVERARRVMGHIWLDPFSHPEANKIVKAERFFTEADDGLKQSWKRLRFGDFHSANAERLFINPPGGLVNKAWLKLIQEWPFEWLWVGFSLEQLQTLQNACKDCGAPHPLEFNYCIPNRRIAYVENAAKRAARERKLRAQGKEPGKSSSPSHGSYIVYHGANMKRFEREFGSLGYVSLN